MSGKNVANFPPQQVGRQKTSQRPRHLSASCCRHLEALLLKTPRKHQMQGWHRLAIPFSSVEVEGELLLCNFLDAQREIGPMGKSESTIMFIAQLQERRERVPVCTTHAWRKRTKLACHCRKEKSKTARSEMSKLSISCGRNAEPQTYIHRPSQVQDVGCPKPSDHHRTTSGCPHCHLRI